jgi:hypothetical protein
MNIVIPDYITSVTGVAADIPGRGVIGIQGNMMNIVVFKKVVISPYIYSLPFRIINFAMSYSIPATIDINGCP